MKLTQEDVISLLSDEISVGKYRTIQSEVSDRISEIMKYLGNLPAYPVKTGKPYIRWWEYDPYDGGTKGELKANYIRDNKIPLIGDFQFPRFVIFFGCDCSIPLSWLWEDYKQVVEDWKRNYDVEYYNEVTKKKEQAKLLNQKKKEEKEKLIEQIQSKLTKEELKVVRFK